MLFFRFIAASLSLKDESRLGLDNEFFDIGFEQIVLLDGDSTVSLDPSEPPPTTTSLRFVGTIS